ncbi:hypothetical protein ACJO5Y_17735 [Marinobacter sp. GN3S48]|uniref:hypothetical protein n=1 Tax=Marinobacter sp. GN3S48 TaxID=3382302 RepID=UPI00387B03CE
MIREDGAVPTGSEFFELLNQKDYLKLIRDWRDVIFHTVFVKKKDGLELPMLLDLQGNQAFLASPDPVGVRAALADFEAPEGADVFIKPVPLGELARNAFMLGAWLSWLGEEIVMNESLMSFLGMKAVGRNHRGVECLYESQVLNLQKTGGEGGPEVMKAQQWHLSTISDGVVSREPEVAYVYDDEVSVLLGADTTLLNRSKGRSQLSQEEQALFDYWNQPVYDFSALADSTVEESGPEPEDSYIPRPSLISNEQLDSFFDLERAVHNQLMPVSDRLELEVLEGKAMSEKDTSGDADIEWVESREYRIRFMDHSDWLLPLGGSGLPMEEFSEQIALPSQPGSYPMPENLKSRLVRHIAWVLFWKGRDPGKPFSLVLGQFYPAIPYRPDNLKRLFVPDYDNPHFPFLASMACGPHKLPVLVHGEVPEGYVCESLEKWKVPARDLPRGIPDRDSLLINGVLSFGTMCSSLVVPVDAIEFPEAWYQGVRTSNTQLISDFRYFLKARAAGGKISGSKPEASDPGSIGKVLMAGLSFVAFIALLIVMTG